MFRKDASKSTPSLCARFELLEDRRMFSVAPGWFDANLQDAGIRAQSANLSADGSLSRNDVIGILNNAVASTGAGVVGAARFSDLQTLANNSVALGMTPDVQNLLGKLALGNRANTFIKGDLVGGLTPGNLAASSTGAQLGQLESKWFLGGDHPAFTSSTPKTVSYQVFNGPLFNSTGPVNQDVKQHGADCYFDSAAASMALYPQLVRDAVVDNGDGTFTVKLFRDDLYRSTRVQQWDYVTVDNQLPVNSATGGLYDAFTPTGATWFPLLEKAFAQTCAEGWNTQAMQYGAHKDSNSYTSLYAGYPDQAMQELSGGITQQIMNFSSPNAQATIDADIAAGDIITLGTTGHEISLVGYDPVAKTYTVRNQETTSSGLRVCTWTTLSGYYNFYATVPPAGSVAAPLLGYNAKLTKWNTGAGKGAQLAVSATILHKDAGTLTYQWSVLSGPGAVSFTGNGTNAGKNTTAVFSQAGTYVLRALITDPSTGYQIFSDTASTTVAASRIGPAASLVRSASVVSRTGRKNSGASIFSSSPVSVFA